MLNTCLLIIPEYYFAFNYTLPCYAYLLQFPCFLFCLFFLSSVSDAKCTCFVHSLIENCAFLLNVRFLNKWNRGYGFIHNLVQTAGFISSLCEIGLCRMCAIKIRLLSSKQPNRLNETRWCDVHRNLSFLHFFLVYCLWKWMRICVYMLYKVYAHARARVCVFV